jgi:RHS repeat-associated protein
LSNVARSKNQFKYNGQEFQDEFELNMTAMDFRQYDNALGRFHGVDLLAELDYSGSPYSFGFNNPVYFSDPSGLFPSQEAAMAHINQYGLSNATVSFGDVGWIVSNGGYNFFQDSNGTMWLNYVSNDGVNFEKLNGGGGGGSFSSGGFGSSNAGGFASSNNGGFGSSNGGGFSSGGGSSAGGSFVSGSGNNTNPSTTYYGNYVGPGSDIIDPRHMRFVLKIEPVDIIDLAAYYHDIAYFDAGVGGVDGALNSIRVLEADKNLAIQSYVVMGMFWRGDTDPMTKKPVSFETFMWARGVFNLFGSISIYKQHRVNQYNATINNH